jgi:hypothetical protein
MNGHEPRGLQYGPGKQGVADPSHTQPSGFNPRLEKHVVNAGHLHPVVPAQAGKPVLPAFVEIRIEELALHGFSPVDRYRLADAVERELARLFADQGVPASLAQGHEIAHLNGGRFEVATGSNAEGIGVQVAQALYGGLTR